MNQSIDSLHSNEDMKYGRSTYHDGMFSYYLGRIFGYYRLHFNLTFNFHAVVLDLGPPYYLSNANTSIVNNLHLHVSLIFNLRETILNSGSVKS